jgi:two-component system copper resistance phosphate regulon response regulator CusR
MATKTVGVDAGYQHGKLKKGRTGTVSGNGYPAPADGHQGQDTADGSARVLLVEDDARIADFLVRGLSRLGIEVTVTEDVEVGAFLASTEAFELVILDLGLPLIPELEVLRLLQAERPLTPVIALTAGDQLESRDAILMAGAADCLTKPLVFEELCERVLAHLAAPLDGAAG